jgi:hypothetical protein
MLIFMTVCVVRIVASVWRPYTLKGFRALWDNIITVTIEALLKETVNLCTLVCVNSALKQKRF